jgi:hypothetical protein
MKHAIWPNLRIACFIHLSSVEKRNCTKNQALTVCHHITQQSEIMATANMPFFVGAGLPANTNYRRQARSHKVVPPLHTMKG